VILLYVLLCDISLYMCCIMLLLSVSVWYSSMYDSVILLCRCVAVLFYSVLQCEVNVSYCLRFLQICCLVCSLALLVFTLNVTLSRLLGLTLLASAASIGVHAIDVLVICGTLMQLLAAYTAKRCERFVIFFCFFSCTYVWMYGCMYYCIIVLLLAFCLTLNAREGPIGTI